MTTIVSNGYHLIVDKRTTSTHDMPVSGYGDKKITTKIQSKSDLGCKIITPDKWHYKDKKIIAATAAGIKSEFELLYKSFDKANVEAVTSVLNSVGYFHRTTSQPGAIVLLTEDFHTVLINISKRSAVTFLYKPGVVVVAGGGENNFHSLSKFIRNEDKANLRPVDVFLYSVSRSDLYSSMIFDHFDSTLKKSFLNLRPSTVSVKTSIDRLNQMVDLHNAPKDSENEQSK